MTTDQRLVTGESFGTFTPLMVAVGDGVACTGEVAPTTVGSGVTVTSAPATAADALRELEGLDPSDARNESRIREILLLLAAFVVAGAITTMAIGLALRTWYERYNTQFQASAGAAKKVALTLLAVGALLMATGAGAPAGAALLGVGVAVLGTLTTATVMSRLAGVFGATLQSWGASVGEAAARSTGTEAGERLAERFKDKYADAQAYYDEHEAELWEEIGEAALDRGVSRGTDMVVDDVARGALQDEALKAAKKAAATGAQDAVHRSRAEGENKQ